MKLILFLFLYMCALSAHSTSMQDDTIPASLRRADVANRLTTKYKFLQNNKTSDEGVWNVRNVTTTKGGELAELLGDEANDIDSLVVSGPINEDDIHTLWSASLNGFLSVINLENAEIENGIIPDDAFFHQDEQYHSEEGMVDVIRLRRIIFPESLKGIGYKAFSYAVNLEEINIPSSLVYIDTYAFSDCKELKASPLVFPEGFERFGNLVFLNCRKLRGQIVLPTTLKEIGDGAFFSSKITSIIIPEGLKKLGDAAFYGCRLKEVSIPASCQDIEGDSHFGLNYMLEKATLADGITRLPGSFFYNCIELKEVELPSTLKVIDNSALWQCISLKKLDLPEGLESIEWEALYDLRSLEQIVFPSTLKKIGAESCLLWAKMKRIYCKATEPPVCEHSGRNVGYTPFGPYDSGETDIPVYVPVGCAEKYRKAWGWDHFKTFIETDDFPTAINSVTVDQPKKDNRIYDLSGKMIKHPKKGQICIVNGKKVVFDH